MQITKMIDKNIFVGGIFLQPAQRVDGKWIWEVVSFGYDAEIYDEKNNRFAKVKTEANSAIDLLIERKES